MGKHSKGKDKADQDEGTFSGDLGQEDKPARTMESDSGGIQGLEYFGVDTREDTGD